MVYDSLGNRIKSYEAASSTVLTPRIPVIIRLDGCHFHSYTRGCSKPFDLKFNHVMNLTAIKLCEEIQGAQIAYIQSDEISILVHGYKRFNSSSWFDNQVQKMVSVSASIAGATFTANSGLIFDDKQIRPAYFDSRVFVVPESDVCNAFIWRQQDCVRNSIQMLARSLYSHSECNNKNCSDLQEMCFLKGYNWNNLPTELKQGRCVIKEIYNIGTDNTIRSRWVVDREIPDFKDPRAYIERFLECIDI